MTSTVGSPLRSSSALVATVVPILTAAIRSREPAVPRRDQQVPDARHRCVAILLGVLRQQLVRDERTAWVTRHDVGERTPAIDPETPRFRSEATALMQLSEAAAAACMLRDARQIGISGQWALPEGG